jgi:hypothetical protein
MEQMLLERTARLNDSPIPRASTQSPVPDLNVEAESAGLRGELSRPPSVPPGEGVPGKKSGRDEPRNGGGHGFGMLIS